MQELLDSIRTFWATWGSWIALSLIPTIITGLAVSPRTRPAVSWVQKIWDGIKQFLSVFSITTFKNEPGTFQLPLKLNKLAKSDGEDRMVPPPASRGPGVLMVVLAVSVGSQTACSSLSRTGEKVKDVAVDCATEVVKTNVEQLWPVVQAVLVGAAPDWRKMLVGLMKEFGRDAVACALRETTIIFQSKVSAAGQEPSPDSQAAMSGLTKARTFIDEQKWFYAGQE